MASICTVKRILLLKQHFCFSYSPCCCCCLFVSHTFLVCEINGSYENTHIYLCIYTQQWHDVWQVLTLQSLYHVTKWWVHLCVTYVACCFLLSSVSSASSSLYLRRYRLFFYHFFVFCFFFGFFRFPTELSAIIFATATATVATGGVTMSHIQILMLLHVFTCLHICMCVCVHRCSVPVFTWWVPLTSASGGLKASFQLTKWLCAVTLP